ncbi:MAG: ATP-binding protein [Oligoflexia bacterium]|nr:ATP-binding protein [Oligoflexia bacterium]
MKLTETIFADLHNVDTFCMRIRKYYKDVIDKRDLFVVELLLRESLNNAVIHGSNQDQNKKIQCLCLLVNNEFIIEVEDEGSGFDWRNKLNDEINADPFELPSRGLLILNQNADQLKFNQRGNKLYLKKSLRASTTSIINVNKKNQ